MKVVLQESQRFLAISFFLLLVFEELLKILFVAEPPRQIRVHFVEKITERVHLIVVHAVKLPLNQFVQLISIIIPPINF